MKSPADVTAIVDNREQQPFDLDPMLTVGGTLATADYSVVGLESIIAVERKSLPDLIGCVGRERERFERELQRLKAYPCSCVLVEASWQDLETGNWRSKVTANAAMGSVTSWMSQGHNVVLAGDRAMAQRICRSILYHAAKNRWRELQSLLTSTQKAKS